MTSSWTAKKWKFISRKQLILILIDIFNWEYFIWKDVKSDWFILQILSGVVGLLHGADAYLSYVHYKTGRWIMIIIGILIVYNFAMRRGNYVIVYTVSNSNVNSRAWISSKKNWMLDWRNRFYVLINIYIIKY